MPVQDLFIPSEQVPVSNSMVEAFGGPRKMPDRYFKLMRQPFLDSRGRACVVLPDLRGEMTQNDAPTGHGKRGLLRSYVMADLFNKGIPVDPLLINATSLTKAAWIYLSTTIAKSFRQRLTLVGDLEANVSTGGFNAMSKMTYEYQAMNDPGEAFVDMDLETDGRNDIPQYILRSVPLPCTHSDFGFSERFSMVSNSGGVNLQTTMGEAAGRRVAESLEDQAIGNVTGVTYGTQSSGYPTHDLTSTVFGLTTYTNRLTKTNFTAPSAGGWVPSTTQSEINTALEQLRAQFSYGPWVMYHSTDWSPYLDGDYFYSLTSGAVAPTETLRSRLLKIPDLAGIKRLDRLTSTFTLLFVPMDREVIEFINGADITTIQWQEKGGLALRFKVYAIKVPLPKSDYAARCGILHGTTS